MGCQIGSIIGSVFFQSITNESTLVNKKEGRIKMVRPKESFLPKERHEKAFGPLETRKRML
jgi:hypothetical protein